MTEPKPGIYKCLRGHGQVEIKEGMANEEIRQVKITTAKIQNECAGKDAYGMCRCPISELLENQRHQLNS